jgi:hypothetical protein
VLDTFVLAQDMAITPVTGVTLNLTRSGDNPTEYAISEDPAFPGVNWLPFMGGLTYNLSGIAGLKTIYLKLRNTSGESAVLSDTITYDATQPTAASVLFTQYYEGISNNKYVEITNLTNDPIDISTWKLARWTNAEAELWRISGFNPSGVFTLSGILQAKQTIVLGHNLAALAKVTPFQSSSELSMTGNDSMALYSGSASPATLVDVFSFTNTGNEGQDKAFRRISTAPGFSFTAPVAITAFASVWEELTLAAVGAANPGSDSEHLGTYYTSAVGYAAWAATSFPTITDPAVIGFNADPDGDGVPNGLEHILYTNPNAVSTTFGMLAAPAPGTFTAQHTKLSALTNVTLAYKWSTDLRLWHTSGESDPDGNLISLSTTSVSTHIGYTTEEVTAIALTGNPRRIYLRIEATKP